MNKDNVKKAIKDILNHSVIKHLGSGSATLPQVRVFAIQFGFLSAYFPKIMARAMSCVQDTDTQFELLRNLWDEYGCGNRENDHRKMYNKFLNALGIDKLDQTQMLPSTWNYINGMLDICSTENNDGRIMGVISYGSEYHTANQFNTIAKGLLLGGFLTKDDLIYFYEHADHDGQHMADLQFLIDQPNKYGDSSDIYLSALATIELEKKFWDGIGSAYSSTIN